MIKNICATIVFTCIIVGALLSIIYVWDGVNEEVTFKGVVSLAIVAAASLGFYATHSAFYKETPAIED